jgi:hypothetical protein
MRIGFPGPLLGLSVRRQLLAGGGQDGKCPCMQTTPSARGRSFSFGATGIINGYLTAEIL